LRHRNDRQRKRGLEMPGGLVSGARIDEGLPARLSKPRGGRGRRVLSCARIALVLLPLAGTRTAPAAAPQDPRDPDGVDPPSGADVNDPTAPLSLVQFRDILAPDVPGYDGPANLLEIQPVLPIGRSQHIPFAQLIKVTVPVATSPDPGGTTGLGDVEIFDLASIKAPWGRWGIGPVFVIPTATDDELGQGKWQAGPAAAIIVTAVKGLQAGAVFENPISFAGDSKRERVNALSITPTVTYNLPSGWFGGYSDIDLEFDWENGGEATIPLGAQVGKVFKAGTVTLSASVETAYLVARPDGTPRWVAGFEFTWVLPSHPK